MRPQQLALLVTVFTLVLPHGAIAQSKKTTPDRELAAELSASLAMVASEGQRFSDARDELARSRVLNMQNLENATLWVQQGNEFDIVAWEVVEETYRLHLYQAVIDATDNIAARRAATAERQAQQAQDLAAAKSAVNVKTAQLMSAAGSLAALAEPPPSGEALSALIKTTLTELTASLGDENPKLKQGLELAGGVLDKILPPTNP